VKGTKGSRLVRGFAAKCGRHAAGEVGNHVSLEAGQVAGKAKDREASCMRAAKSCGHNRLSRASVGNVELVGSCNGSRRIERCGCCGEQDSVSKAVDSKEGGQERA
jgi:hypothetical protein